MKISLYRLFDLISLSSSFLLTYTAIFIIQYYTIGLIPLLSKSVILDKFYLRDIIFMLSSAFITFKFVKFNTPYREYLSKR